MELLQLLDRQGHRQAALPLSSMLCTCEAFARAALAQSAYDVVFGSSVSAVEMQGGSFVGICECGLRFGTIPRDAA
jgi:hypothetical protein